MPDLIRPGRFLSPGFQRFSTYRARHWLPLLPTGRCCQNLGGVISFANRYGRFSDCSHPPDFGFLEGHDRVVVLWACSKNSPR